jgi:hypothetical protein
MAAKRGRKSAAEKAAEAAAQELALVKTKDGEKVAVDLEPASTVEAPETPAEAVEAPTPSEDTPEVVIAPENAAGEVTEELQAVEKAETEAELAAVVETVVEPVEVPEVVESKKSKKIELEKGFKPILRPTNVAGEPKGYIACPKAVFDLVQTEGWEDLIETHTAKVALKSVLYWRELNGEAKVRCMSSSRFADVK